MSSTNGNVRSKTNEVLYFIEIFFQNISFCLISDIIARSVSDETEATVEQIPRESQGTPSQTPSTTVQQSYESLSFFGRQRRHRHHSRQPHRSRRYKVRRNMSHTN